MINKLHLWRKASVLALKRNTYVSASHVVSYQVQVQELCYKFAPLLVGSRICRTLYYGFWSKVTTLAAVSCVWHDTGSSLSPRKEALQGETGLANDIKILCRKRLSFSQVDQLQLCSYVTDHRLSCCRGSTALPGLQQCACKVHTLQIQRYGCLLVRR